jgi:hypothetical protein
LTSKCPSKHRQDQRQYTYTTWKSKNEDHGKRNQPSKHQGESAAETLQLSHGFSSFMAERVYGRRALITLVSNFFASPKLQHHGKLRKILPKTKKSMLS